MTGLILSQRYLAIGVAAGMALIACESPSPSLGKGTASLTSAPTASPQVPPSELTLLTDASQVCMVNNQFMGRPQIPVQVEGKTYYGCCAMCKGRLESDASARTAVDPVSHATVDKATAVIGKKPDGSTIYFASRGNFDSYARRTHAP